MGLYGKSEQHSRDVARWATDHDQSRRAELRRQDEAEAAFERMAFCTLHEMALGGNPYWGPYRCSAGCVCSLETHPTRTEIGHHCAEHGTADCAGRSHQPIADSYTGVRAHKERQLYLG